MKPRVRKPHRVLLPILLGTLGLLKAQANWPPRIDFIEPFSKDLLLLHFDMAPNRYYQIQYTESLTPTAGSWTNLLNQPIFSQSGGHFVALDTRLRPRRFYRLLVYP